MLVVISDLHFVDETAGKHNVPPSAFSHVFLSDIVALSKHTKAKEIQLLLLGDIIDLLRTTHWLRPEVQPEDRPWGKNGLKDEDKFDSTTRSETEKHCHKILDDIVGCNQKTFNLFASLKDKFDGLPVKLTYLPGNHDRLVNCYPSLRDRVAKLLGLTIDKTTVTGYPGANWRYPTIFESVEYSVLARHGHEFDLFNYGGQGKDDIDGHLRISIGDVLTTEIAARLAYLLVPKLEDIIHDPQDSAEASELVYQIDNVRPWTGIPEYLRSHFSTNKEVWKAVKETLRDIGQNLLSIPYAKSWFWDANQSLASDLGAWLEGHINTPVSETVADDAYAKAAIADYEERDKRFKNVLYGHTHSPMQAPLDWQDNGPSMYINTGTWRARVLRTIGQEIRYANLKTMTYAIFYRGDEDVESKKPHTVSFDVWTGWENKVRKEA